MGWHWGILAGSGAGPAGSYEHIDSIILSSAQSTVTFNSISTTAYKHLQLRIVAKHTGSSADQLYIRFNNDSGSNYTQHQLAGNGSTVFSQASTAGTQSWLSVAPRTITATTNAFATAVVDILDYSSTSKNTTFRSLNGMLDGDGNNRIGLHSGLWLNTAAVTRIDLFSFSFNLQTGSRFSLYGIKG